MRRKIIVWAVAVAVIFGLSAYRSLPKRAYDGLTAAQSATVENATNAQTAILVNSETYYPVTKVVDGDTVAVNINGKNATIRLIGLDTPETVDPRKLVQCFGKEASARAKEILAGKRVRLEMDGLQGQLDKYGRLLAYVFLEGGALFNKLMIAEGYGHEYTYHLPYKYQKEFKEAEKTARENQKGLWAPEACQGQASQINAMKPAQIPADISSGGYDCSRNAYNCSSFKTQAEAQYVFGLCGGNTNDIHKLDRDMDGKVCESLP